MDVRMYVDYGSPYSYLAWQRLRRFPERYAGHDVSVIPVSAGHIFKWEGGKPNAAHPNLLRYNDLDVPRWASAYGIPYTRPHAYPQRTLDASRCHHHLRARDPQKADRWTEICFLAHWTSDADLQHRSVLDDLAQPLGFSVDAALRDGSAREALVRETEAAYAAGAPGVPFVVIEGRGFWGSDRLDWVEADLAAQAAPPVGVAPSDARS